MVCVDVHLWVCTYYVSVLWVCVCVCGLGGGVVCERGTESQSLETTSEYIIWKHLHLSCYPVCASDAMMLTNWS